MLRALLAVVALALLAPAAAPAKTTWLCQPGLRGDPCASDRTATAVAADGARTVERFTARGRRTVDCFYVYPTVSRQPTLNANIRLEDPLVPAVATLQASRFAQTCRVFAPLYRQVTVGGLTRGPAQVRPGVDLAYRDVRAAWREYLARDNHGRGVILIGHSQGAGLLTRLVRDEIDRRPKARRRLVSALLIGGNVLVPAGRDVGGSFAHVPACRSHSQTGCVVAFNTYDQPPPDPSLFARGPSAAFDALFGTGLTGADLRTLCVNPAAPAGGATAALDPFFPANGTVATPWVTYPNRYTAHCASAGTATWLQVDAAPGDPRPAASAQLGPAWGLHHSDVSLTLGDLVALAGAETAAYGRAHR